MSTPGSGHPLVTAALSIMAAKRQATVSAETLDLFSADLAEDGVPVERVVEACKRLGRAERAEGETAFPSYGTLLRVCREVARDDERARVAKLAAEGERRLLAEHEVEVKPLTKAEAKAFTDDLKARVAALRERTRVH